MTLPAAPIVYGDNAEKCTACGRPLGDVFVAGQLQRSWRGHAVCGACKPTVTWFGDAPDWRSFACERCGRRVHYHQGRGYRYCTYRCAAAVWTKGATERRSRYRAEHRLKHLACEVCRIPFTALRSDARYCSITCRQRAHRKRVTA